MSSNKYGIPDSKAIARLIPNSRFRILAFEDQNAREWDSDTFISDENDTEVTNSNVIRDNNLHTLVDVSSPSVITETISNRRTPATAIGRQKYNTPSSGRGQSHAAIQRLKSARGLGSIKTAPSEDSTLNANRRKDKACPTTTKWAKAEGLVTHRRAIHRRDLATEKAEKQKYLDPPSEQEEFPATASYIWPYWYESATTLLGPRLEDLNQIRLDNRVWIEWDESSKCIKISSRSIANADIALEDAVRGIRDAVNHAKAARVTANPLHLVHPPATFTMRKLIKPLDVQKHPLRATNLQLKGEKLPEKERLEWDSSYNEKLKHNTMQLERHLTKNLLVYAPVKHWMRMRVHFGNITMSKFTTEFGETGCSWSAFEEMIAAPRFSAAVDRDLGDAKLALILKAKICQSNEIFCSVHGRVNLDDIQFKDTEIIHFQINGQRFMIEGEMDRSFDNPNQAYQMGSNTLYKDNRRNVLVETRIIDIESGLDWKLELIGDNKDKVLNLPLELQTLIKDSVPSKTKLRTDVLGLKFPDVTPKPSHSVFINSVCIRSTIKYRMMESGYILEISIYRRWEAATTEGQPEMSCSVSMFHPDWDEETQDLFVKPYGRNWKDDLSNFFKKGDNCDTGLEYFLIQVHKVQTYIMQARKELIEQAGDPIDLLGI